MAAEAVAVPLLLDQMAVQLLAETEATEPHLVSLVHLLPTLAAVAVAFLIPQQPLAQVVQAVAVPEGMEFPVQRVRLELPILAVVVAVVALLLQT